MTAVPPPTTQGTIPARAGIGLRAQHHVDVVQQRPPIGWLEVHSENYFGEGGAALEYLRRARELYPLSLHGVGLSIGSTDALSKEHLLRLKQLIQRTEPALVSEHLCWGAAAGRHFNDLLPLPYTQEALRHMINRVTEVQEFLGRQILIENVSSYLQFTHSEIPEWEFLRDLAKTSGCGLLVDVNNIYVSARNHRFDARHYLSSLPRESVGEIHLAGHSINRYGEQEILIDSHGVRVSAAVWDLYGKALQLFGATPTLIEWDTDLPELEVLVAEAARAERYLEETRGLAA